MNIYKKRLTTTFLSCLLACALPCGIAYANTSYGGEYPIYPKHLPKADGIGIDLESLEAREFKAQIREIASQLLDVYPGVALQGRIVLPTSFVNLDNFDESSSFGRYVSEALMYEFTLRGLPVLEYRLNGAINLNEGGEFALTRHLANVSYKNSKINDILLVGTYYKDQGAIMINARLVQPDGLVLRAAQLVLPMRGLLARMTTLPPLSTGYLPIKGR